MSHSKSRHDSKYVVHKQNFFVAASSVAIKANMMLLFGHKFVILPVNLHI